MKKFILLFILLLAVVSYAQEKVLDKMELRSGQVLLGKVEKIKTDIVEFRESETDLIYESAKKEIRYIQLANGEVLTFEDDLTAEHQEDSQNTTVEEADSIEAGLIILVGFNAGYGFLNMNDVNKDLQDSENIFSSVGATTKDPEEISGGMFLEGNFKLGLGQFNIGVSGNYISSSGEFSYNDVSGSFTETYDVSTIEILGIFETVFKIHNSSTQLFIQLGGGIGLASSEHLGDFKYFPDPIQNISVENSVKGNYFAGRIKGGLQFNLKKVILELGIGYRIANAGELKGTHTENGIEFSDLPVRDINGNAIEFDYSGFLISAGISFKL